MNASLNLIVPLKELSDLSINRDFEDSHDFRTVARNAIYRRSKEEKSARTRHMHDVMLSCPRMLAIRKQIFLYRKAQ